MAKELNIFLAKVIKMKVKSKKTELLSSAIMFPRNKKLYSLNSDCLVDFSQDYPNFLDFVYKKTKKSPLYKKLSKYSECIKLAEDKGYISFDRAVSGTLFYLPKGDFVFDAIHEYVSNQIRQEGFIKLKLPYFFRSDLNKNWKEMNPLEQLTLKYKKRMIKVLLGKDIFQRYASDPMLFEYLRDKNIPIDPLKIYSPGFIFRKERKGELRRLKRSRTSYIEDYHVFTSNVLKQSESVHKLNSRIMNELCNEWFISCDIEKKFFEAHQKHLQKLINMCQKPVLFNILKTKVHYYALQFKYIYAVSDGTFVVFANLQLDDVNGKRFNIQIKNKKTTKVIHGNMTGRMEKVFIALFDKAIKMKKKSKKPVLPFWVSPIQVRIIPLNKNFIDYCIALSQQYIDSGFRIDVDDREIKINKKIQSAEQDWIPCIIIIGQKEVEANKITLRIRNEKQQVISVVQSLANLERKIKNYPRVRQYLPALVSKQIDLNSL